MVEKFAFKFTGKIKAVPEDFIVEEVWEDRVCTVEHAGKRPAVCFGEPRDYLRFTMVKRDWDTIKALSHLARKLRVSIKRFGIAGMKDKRAVTSQRVSVWRVNAEDLASISLPDIHLKDFEYSDERICLGDAIGNRFTVTIRDVPLPKGEIAKALEAFGSYVKGTRMPNFFGSQRVGRGRDNAEIGRAIKEGRLDVAVSMLTEKVRTYAERGRVDDIPDVFWVEKRVLNHLRSKPNDFAGALRKVPKKLLRIFPAAFQASAFNERLARAIEEGSVPESIEVEGFEVKRMPELSAMDLRRPSYLRVKDFAVIDVGDGFAKIRFALGKGEYATTFLSHLLDGINP
ncbi:MAG: tRNA pseudouridine(13) synthase TruD [Thermoproteota archaeon]